jgi:hypothetical protein
MAVTQFVDMIIILAVRVKPRGSSLDETDNAEAAESRITISPL